MHPESSSHHHDSFHDQSRNFWPDFWATIWSQNLLLFSSCCHPNLLKNWVNRAPILVNPGPILRLDDGSGFWSEDWVRSSKVQFFKKSPIAATGIRSLEPVSRDTKFIWLTKLIELEKLAPVNCFLKIGRCSIQLTFQGKLIRPSDRQIRTFSSNLKIKKSTTT